MRLIARTALLLTVFLAIGVVATPASAVVATFKTTADLAITGNGYPFVYNNEGAEYWLPIGDWGFDQRAIMRFDVSSLGSVPNLRVDSITLKLFSVGAGYFEPTMATTPMSVEIRAIKSANRDWTEGPGIGYDFVPWQTCGLAKKTGATSGSIAAPWAGSAGLMTPGVDYDSTALATRSLVKSEMDGQGEAVNFQFNGDSSQLTGLIKTWLTDNSLHRDNPGLLICDPAWTIGTQRRVGFFSRECTNPPHPPENP
jgi:hypothetical protein